MVTIYLVTFADGAAITLPVSAMSTQEYRLANGGKSNLDLVREQLQKHYPKKRAVKIRRGLTGEVIWEEESCHKS